MAARGRLGKRSPLTALCSEPAGGSCLVLRVKAKFSAWSYRILQERPPLFPLTSPIVCNPFSPGSNHRPIWWFCIPIMLLPQGLCPCCSRCFGCSLPVAPSLLSCSSLFRCHLLEEVFPSHLILRAFMCGWAGCSLHKA